jgi:hypothetical protein
MKLNIHFEPEQIRINGTITVTDEEDNIVDEYKQSFVYQWNEFGEIIDLND